MIILGVEEDEKKETKGGGIGGEGGGRRGRREATKVSEGSVSGGEQVYLKDTEKE